METIGKYPFVVIAVVMLLIYVIKVLVINRDK